jgi:hypothetical protein
MTARSRACSVRRIAAVRTAIADPADAKERP